MQCREARQKVLAGVKDVLWPKGAFIPLVSTALEMVYQSMPRAIWMIVTIVSSPPRLD